MAFPEYEVVLCDEETDRIGVLLDAPADVWVTVRATADPKACSVDRKAPILVHEGHAHQVINEAPGLAVRTPLLPEGPAAPGA